MKAPAFTLIDALPLALIRGICKADWRERVTVNKTALSDRRELVVFRE